MANTPGGITRTVALWVMMVTAAVADAILYWQGQIVWGVFWSMIIGLVIAFEIWGVFFSPWKKTISNMWRDWIIWEKENKKFPWGRVTLFLLWVSLNALIVHLWFF